MPDSTSNGARRARVAAIGALVIGAVVALLTLSSGDPIADSDLRDPAPASVSGEATDIGRAELPRTTVQSQEQVETPIEPRETDPNAVRIMSGVVRDLSGPLPSGSVTVLHPLRQLRGDYSDRRARLAPDGTFRCELSAEVHDQPFAFVNIADGQEIVFAGALEVREGLDVWVVSSAQDPQPLLGELALPDARDDDRWWIAVMARRGQVVTAIASSGDRRSMIGKAASLRLFRQNPLMRGFADPVVLIALEREDREPLPAPWFFRRVLGHAAFDSLGELDLALKNRLVIDAPLRGLRLPPSPLEEPEQVFCIPTVSGRAVYHGRPESDRSWSFHLPAGDYRVAARFLDGSRRMANASIRPADRTIELVWAESLPGPESLTITVRDEAGAPVAGARLRFAIDGPGVPLHSGRSVVGDDGAVLVSGLLSKPYRFQAGNAAGTLLAVSTCDPSTTDHLRLQATMIGTVVLEPLAAAAVTGGRIDASETAVWWRLEDGASTWNEVSARDRRYAGFSIGGLPVGREVELALHGPWWEGRRQVVVAEGLSTARVVLEPLVELTGTVIGARGDERVRWAWNTAAASTPWQVCDLGADGGFSLEVPLERLAEGQLLVERDGQVVARQLVSARRTAGIRVRVR